MVWSRRNRVPVVFFSIDGDSADDLRGRLVSFQYKQKMDTAATTEFTFRNDDRSLASDTRLQANVPWQFRYGYVNDLSPIIIGHIRNIVPDYGLKRLFKVTLMDLSIQLKKTSQGRNWGRVRSSTIAEKIAKIHRLESQVEDSKDIPENDFVQPASVNDLQYLRDLASAIDFEVFVDGNPPTLVYRSTGYDLPPGPQKLVYFDDPSEFAFVKSFKPKIKSLGAKKESASKTNTKKKKTESRVEDKGEAGQAALPWWKTFKILGVGASAIAKVGKPDVVGTIDTFVDPSATPVNSHGIRAPVFSAPQIIVGAHGGQGVVTLEDTNIVSEKPVNTPGASGSNARRMAAVKRQQMLDKAQEATSEHPLTASFKMGIPYVWQGLDGPLNRKWYLTEIDAHIDGKSSGVKCKWKRDDPAEAKKGTGGGSKTKDDIPAGPITIGETRIESEKPPQLLIIKSLGSASQIVSAGKPALVKALSTNPNPSYFSDL